MTGFSDDEIQGVVDQLVRVSVRRPYDSLGVRRTDITFSDMQEAAAGVFVLYPDTPFYLAKLSRDGIASDLGGVQTVLKDFLQSLSVLRRRVLPVRDLSSLANAQSALTELEGVVANSGAASGQGGQTAGQTASGQGGVRDVSAIPSYVRFNASVDRFLQGAGQNVKAGGQIVATPQEARVAIPTQLADLRTAVADLVRRVGLLSRADKDYNGIGLPRLLSQGIVQRARQLLSSRLTQLEAMTEDERLTVLRQTVLELLGAKAVVKKFGAFQGLSSTTSVTGTFKPFSDADRPAQGASLSSDKRAPFVLVPGMDAATSTNVVSFWLDGATSASDAPSAQLYLPPSMQPKIEGQQTGPFTIVAGKNNKLQFLVGGTALVNVTLPSGTQSVASIAAVISTALAPYNYKAEAYFAPLMFEGVVDILSPNQLELSYGTFPPNSVHVNDEVDFLSDFPAGETRIVLDVIPDEANPEQIKVSGGNIGGLTTRIQYGSSARRLRVVPVDRALAVATRSTIQLKMPTDVERDTGITLGFFGELYGKGTPTDAPFIASFITANTQLITALPEPHVVADDLQVLSVPGNSLKVSAPGATLVQGKTLTIEAGPNTGDYLIDLPDSPPSSAQLVTGLAMSRDAFNQPLSMPGVLMDVGVLFMARSTSLTSRLEMFDPLGVFFTTPGPHVATAITGYMKFSNPPATLSVGDRLDLYTTDASNPSKEVEVIRVFSDGVVQLDTSMDALTSYNLGSTTLPFAILKPARYFAFSQFAAYLTNWLTKPALTDTYWTNLNRLISPLLVDLNPTDAAIGAAEQMVKQLGAVLLREVANEISSSVISLDTILALYDHPVVPEADALVQSFKEKGGDRAVDLLLECQFATFFGLSQEETSYAGNLQKSLRDVAREDLPVQKVNRIETSQLSLVSSAPSPDYEYDDSDIDPTPPIDAPTD